MEPQDVSTSTTSEPSPADKSSYPPPVQHLFQLGSARENTKPELWSEYLKLGIGPEHVPDLIRVAQGWRRHWFDKEETPAVWAHIHAWRALGQLKATEAIEPLLALLTDMQEKGDDWSLEEIPVVLAQIGPSSIDPIAAYLESPGPDPFSRSAAASGLVKIAKGSPEYRERVVGILTDALSRYATQDPELNGLLLGELLDMKATEALPVIREAFRADQIDETIAGDWGDVRRELNIEPQPDDPPERPVADAWRGRHPDLYGGSGFLRGGSPPTGPHRSIEQRKEAERKRRKRQKQARRQNRKRR
jgi:hypothetical protein